MNEDRKQALIEKHIYINVDHGWWDDVYDDFNAVCGILGFDLDKGEPCFNGFSCQGDGASFAGRYRSITGGYRGGLYVMDPTYDHAPAKIREYAPKDEELHRIADELCVLGRVYYPAYARIGRCSSHYYHSNTMVLDRVEPNDGDDEDWAEAVHGHVATKLLELARDLADWLYRALEREYDYLTDDEAVWETIVANELDEMEEEEDVE